MTTTNNMTEGEYLELANQLKKVLMKKINK